MCQLFRAIRTPHIIIIINHVSCQFLRVVKETENDGCLRADGRHDAAVTNDGRTPEQRQRRPRHFRTVCRVSINIESDCNKISTSY